MKIKLSSVTNQFSGRTAVRFVAEPSENEAKTNPEKRPRLAGGEWFVDLAPGNAVGKIHPDLVALAILVSVGPFVKNELLLPFGVTSGLAELVLSGMKINMGPIDPSLARRSQPKEHAPTLAFSGGVDSCAALKLLPENVVPVFMRRRTPEGVKSLYRADAALVSCDAVRKAGYDVHVLESSVEHIREPVGFPVDWTNCLPIVLNADHFGASSVSFGMVLETAFHLGRMSYSDLGQRSIYKVWAPLFEYVSVPIALPTAGLSEVLTSKISAGYVTELLPQSCVRGTAESSCMRCFKCFRKALLDAIHRAAPVGASHYEIPFESKEVRKKLLETPIHHEIVMAWAMNHLDDEHPVLDALKLKLSSVSEYGNGLSFLDAVYPRGLDYVPEYLRGSVLRKASSYASIASDEDIRALEAWHAHELVFDPRYRIGQEKLSELLS